MSFKVYITDLGQQKLTQALADGTALKITHFAVGQGINVDFSQRLDKQVLVSKRYDSTVTSVAKSAGVANQYEVVCIVPADVGGWFMREMALIDEDGDYIFVGALPEVQKPAPDDPAKLDYRINVVVSLNNPDATLLVNTNVVTASRSWVVGQHQAMMQLLIPIGYKYWSHKPESPKAQFDELLGIETFWRRLQGVQLVAVEDGHTLIGQPEVTTGKQGDVTADTTTPDLFPVYTSYLWERYDPNNQTLRYDGQHKYDGSVSYQ